MCPVRPGVSVVSLLGVDLVCVVEHLLPGVRCSAGKQVVHSQQHQDVLGSGGFDSPELVFQAGRRPGPPVDTLAALLSDLLLLPHPASCGN